VIGTAGPLSLPTTCTRLDSSGQAVRLQDTHSTGDPLTPG
jgi:hypothetical protein